MTITIPGWLLLVAKIGGLAGLVVLAILGVALLVCMKNFRPMG